MPGIWSTIIAKITFSDPVLNAAEKFIYKNRSTLLENLGIDEGWEYLFSGFKTGYRYAEDQARIESLKQKGEMKNAIDLQRELQKVAITLGSVSIDRVGQKMKILFEALKKGQSLKERQLLEAGMALCTLFISLRLNISDDIEKHARPVINSMRERPIFLTFLKKMMEEAASSNAELANNRGYALLESYSA